MTTNNETKQTIKAQLPTYLSQLGYSTSQSFNCLNPNHDDKTPSMTFDAKDGEHVKCFGCGAYWDVFDLIAVEELHSPIIGGAGGKPEPEFSFTDAYNKALQLFNVQASPLKTDLKPVKTRQNNKLTEQIKQATSTVIENSQSKLENTDYFEQRGISLDTAKQYHLGYVSKWVSPTAFFKGATNLVASPRLIIPTSEYSYIARDTRAELDEQQLRYAKMKEGQVHIFNGQALDSNQNIFIVEGEIDALSVIETGEATAIGLGSVNNIDVFDRAIERAIKRNEGNFHPTFYIALDNDTAGQQAINRLKAVLDNHQLTSYTVQIARGYKDANEALVQNKGGLIGDIKQAIKDPNNYLQGLLDYINNSQDVEAIPTGFKNLDTILDGGLYEGLYGLGAISSLGKTTFVLQLADSIAMNGRPVLYFALEMGRFEMMTKSISRHTFINALIDGDVKEAQTTRSILQGHWQERYNKKQLDNVIKSFEQYGDYYNNVVIHDGTETRPTIDDITKVVDQYVLQTGEAPVVIVDYLQILKPANDRATDKANVTTSVNAMKKLATKYHIPVITISSFNRMSYNNKVSMESFKESGDIEYSADVLLGLQLQGTGSEEFDVNEAKAKERRDVEAVVLKNRNGQTGDTLNFSYYPMFNYYTDALKDAEQATPDTPKTQISADGSEVKKPKELQVIDGWEAMLNRYNEYMYRETSTGDVVDAKTYAQMIKDDNQGAGGTV